MVGLAVVGSAVVGVLVVGLAVVGAVVVGLAVVGPAVVGLTVVGDGVMARVEIVRSSGVPADLPADLLKYGTTLILSESDGKDSSLAT